VVGNRGLILKGIICVAFLFLETLAFAQGRGGGTDGGNGGDTIRESFHQARELGQDLVAAVSPEDFNDENLKNWFSSKENRNALREKVRDMNHTWLMDDSSATQCDTLHGDEIILAYRHCRTLVGAKPIANATKILLKNALLALQAGPDIATTLPQRVLDSFAKRFPGLSRQMTAEQHVAPQIAVNLTLNDLVGRYQTTDGKRAPLDIRSMGFVAWRIANDTESRFQFLEPDQSGRYQAAGQWLVPAPGQGLYHDICSYNIRIAVRLLSDGRTLQVNLVRPRNVKGPCGGPIEWVNEELRFERRD
jgi:hypothetical protein